jgi:FeS cluster assembly scaffold protein NifU
MKPTNYSEKVLDHFRNPRNVGTLEGEDVAVGEVGNPVCGDLMEFYIKVEDGRIADIKFKTFGCGSAIATASMITEMAKGKTIEEALKITRQDVADELEGLPPIKMHCSNLAADALHEAIRNYQARLGKETVKAPAGRRGTEEIAGREEFLGKGVYSEIADYAAFKDRRVLLVDTGEDSVRAAIELTKQTKRVVLATPGKRVEVGPKLQQELKQSEVKILYESEILEIRGTGEVEKVLIHDLNEDEQYELFTDAVIIL